MKYVLKITITTIYGSMSNRTGTDDSCKSIQCSCSSEVHVQSFQSQVCTDKEDCKGTEVHVDTCTN